MPRYKKTILEVSLKNGMSYALVAIFHELSGTFFAEANGKTYELLERRLIEEKFDVAYDGEGMVMTKEMLEASRT